MKRTFEGKRILTALVLGGMIGTPAVAGAGTLEPDENRSRTPVAAPVLSEHSSALFRTADSSPTSKRVQALPAIGPERFPVFEASAFVPPRRANAWAERWNAADGVRSQSPVRRRSAARWGIAIGIGAGVAAAGLAAASYGENEGGRFCTRCFVQWSAFSVPIGAGVGAGIGYLIDRARR